MGRDFTFIAQGREFHSGMGVEGPAVACEVARQEARRRPGVLVEVHRDGLLVASYKLVGDRLIARVP